MNHYNGWPGAKSHAVMFVLSLDWTLTVTGTGSCARSDVTVSRPPTHCRLSLHRVLAAVQEPSRSSRGLLSWHEQSAADGSSSQVASRRAFISRGWKNCGECLDTLILGHPCRWFRAAGLAAKSAAKPWTHVAQQGAPWRMKSPCSFSSGAMWNTLEHPGIGFRPSSKRLLGQLPGRGWVRLPCTSASQI